MFRPLVHACVWLPGTHHRDSSRVMHFIDSGLFRREGRVLLRVPRVLLAGAEMAGVLGGGDLSVAADWPCQSQEYEYGE